MAKRFCKLNRRDISEHLGEIHRLVSEPKFVCRSCARSSADKANLCKPAAIPPASCQSKPDSEKAACGLLAETITAAPANALSQELAAKKLSSKELSSKELASKEQSRTAAAKNKSQLVVQKVRALKSVDKPASSPAELLDKSELKRAKKVAKKQKKYNKKLAKMIKKQQKLYKKSQKLQSQLESINLKVDNTVLAAKTAVKVSHIH
ncbi:hypothetical protein KI655_11095 [Vibrio sp. D404a]|uniref:hypothetical protein n=1 Tax=unclassified Vibrio TaxID=2614977 RepID=UPI0025562E2E|nr:MULTISPECIES: hypothetical protein [unclassified Vibrio]MDK9737851.1 hypothetical protein [Vibrio sp. D404a]MDK9795453.1 hypothetical protein [Vibrio sp. D449a]